MNESIHLPRHGMGGGRERLEFAVLHEARGHRRDGPSDALDDRFHVCRTFLRRPQVVDRQRSERTARIRDRVIGRPSEDGRHVAAVRSANDPPSAVDMDLVSTSADRLDGRVSIESTRHGETIERLSIWPRRRHAGIQSNVMRTRSGARYGSRFESRDQIRMGAPLGRVDAGHVGSAGAALPRPGGFHLTSAESLELFSHLKQLRFSFLISWNQNGGVCMLRNALPKTIALLSIVLSGAWSSIARAVDGVVEISQTCATTGGCFAGDSAGFPITITTAGSYRLTGNLDLTGETNPENLTAVDIQSGDVSVDLNGFRITSAEVVGSGIGVFNSTMSNAVAVRNGTVRGMGSDGIRVQGIGAVVENIRAVSNQGTGVSVGAEGLVRDSIALANGNGGIRCLDGGNIIDNVSSRNSMSGITVSKSSRVWGNTARLNSTFGLECIGGGNAAYGANLLFENTTANVSGSCTSLGLNFQ